MLRKLKLWVPLFLLVSISANAVEEIADDLPTIKIEELSVKQLEELGTQVELISKTFKSYTTRTVTPEILDKNAFIVAGTIPVQEMADVVLEMIKGELNRGQSPEFAVQIVMNGIVVLSRMATPTPSKYLDFIKQLHDQWQEGTQGKLVLAYAAHEIGQREGSMPKLREFIAFRRHQEAESKLTPKDKLDAIEKFLRERVIGQPEVVQALMDLEWRNALYGAQQRTHPDAIYTMGLPGTGKDTAAEALTDALHGREGAHEQHMFRVKPLKNQADVWKLLGSNTGFIGSDAFPPFLEFLVKHSDGKYKTEEVEMQGGKKAIKIIENSDYKGQTLPGYFPPNKGVVFLNEFHNWSKQLKDDIVKEALEKGYFSINNPNGGLAQINVPIRFFIASNEGIGLVTSREANGQRHGKAMTYEEVLKKWESVQAQKRILKNEILATNGAVNNPVTGEMAPGISEELLNRIPDRFIIMMRPLSPTDLQTITQKALDKAVKKIQQASDLLKNVTVKWSNDLVKLIQGYDYSAEDNARPVKDRIIGFVEEPLLDAVRSGALQVKQGAELSLDVAENEDRTRRLTVNITESGATREVTQLIRTTIKDIPPAAVSDARIDQLASLAEDLKGLVFGVDNIVDRIAQRLVTIENDDTNLRDRRTTVLMLNGLSSTGKTELAKQVGKLLSKLNGGTETELKTFDFSRIQTLEAFELYILGTRDSRGNPIASEFMKYYDRNNGKIVVAFDELANVRDIKVQTALFDFFRVETMTTFSDGKERPMGGVKVIVTGNAGKEIYDQIPRHLPMSVQMAGWQDIYESANRNFDFQLSFLEKYYPSPLLVRIGRGNIFFMPPHNYRSLRQLAQLKLDEAFRRIKNTESRRGWNIELPSAQEYTKLIDVIIDEGFTLRNQGASIESFIRDDIEEPLKYRLLTEKIASNAKVTIRFNRMTDNTNEDVPGKVYFDLVVEGREQPLSLEITRPHVPKRLMPDRASLLTVAYHEAGHSLAQHVLFGGSVKSTKISIIPGVSLIGDRMIYYAGIAEWEQTKEIPHIREYFVRRIAIWAAGETAERLTTRGARESGGKSNDIERATRAARDAIVKYGLSPKWGITAVPEGVTIDAYVAGLSDEKRKLLEKETASLMREGRELAQRVLEQHFETHLVPLGNMLAEKGEMNREALANFYAERQSSVVDPSTLSLTRRAYLRYKTVFRQWTNRPTQAMAVEILPGIADTVKVADVNQIVTDRKAAQLASVPIPSNAPIATEVAATMVRQSAPNVVDLRAPGSIEAIIAATRVRIRCMEAHMARAQ